MPWFIIQAERKTWTKYLVEARDEQEAWEDRDGWEYFGYVDGDDTESDVVAGPFETKDEARRDVMGWVDG